MTIGPQHLDQTDGFIRRASGFTFFLICLTAGLLTGSVLFFVLGLIAAGLDLSAPILTLMAFVGFLSGLVLPIVYLKRRRRRTEHRSEPQEIRACMIGVGCLT